MNAESKAVIIAAVDAVESNWNWYECAALKAAVNALEHANLNRTIASNNPITED